MDYTIIYSDKDILVVDKPAGVSSQSESNGTNGIFEILKPKYKNLFLINRLDKVVSGLVLFAKTKKSAQILSKLIADHDLTKEYLAVVTGDTSVKNAKLSDYVVKKNNKAEISQATDPQAKLCILDYSIIKNGVIEKAIEKFDGTGEKEDLSIALVNIQLVTGRFHQIRVQLEHAGLSIFGDRKYGSDLNNRLDFEKRSDFLALHAYRLELVHPITNKKMEFVSYPDRYPFTAIK